MYYGKYRAYIYDTNDPKRQGRVRLKIPSVLGDKVSAWAIIVTPYPTDFFGYVKDDTVFVEFEGGHPDRPLVVGTWWRERQTPIAEYNSSYKTNLPRRRLKSRKGHIIELVDKDGEEKVVISDIFGNSIIIDTHSGLIHLGGTNSKSVAREGDTVTVNVNGTNYIGTITSGSSKVKSE